MNAATHRLASRTHKWLALVIGFQLLLWFASGALMAWLPIGEVRGEHLVDRNAHAVLPAEIGRIDPSSLLKGAAGKAHTVTLRVVDGRLLAEASSRDQTWLFDPLTGKRIGMVDAATARKIATAAWKVPVPAVANVGLIRAESTEYRAALPAWKITFADPDKTSVYVAAATGRIAAVRNGTWRLYDFFWGLHIMDWKNHEDFNSPWLLAFAVGGLVMSITGTILLLARWPIRRRRRPG